MIAFEDQIQQGVVVEIGAEALDRGAARQGNFRAIEEHDRHLGAGLTHVVLDHGTREGRRVGLDEMKEAGHQNTRNRSALATSAAIPSGVMGSTVWPSAFHDWTAGAAPSS